MALHPKWKIMLWNDNNLPTMINQHLFEKSKYYAQKADILRYEILWNYGGVYLDVDFECIRNIESLLKGVERFAAFQREKEINNAIIGSIPKDNWMLSIIEKLPYFFKKDKFGAETGPKLITDRTIDRRDVTVFQKELFYPYLWYEPEKANGPFPNSYGIHHWLKSWSTQT
jgi:mannosyltransferase OCH1-like enzyme